MLKTDIHTYITITRGKWYKNHRFRELSLLIFQKHRSADWQARVWSSAIMMPFPAIVNLINESAVNRQILFVYGCLPIFENHQIRWVNIHIILSQKTLEDILLILKVQTYSLEIAALYILYTHSSNYYFLLPLIETAPKNT